MVANRIKSALKYLFPLSVLAALGVAFFRNASHVSWTKISQSPGNFLVAVALEGTGVVGGFLIWKSFLNRELPPGGLTIRPAYRLFSAAALSRYLPGGAAWQIFSFIRLSENHDLKIASTTAFLFNVLVSLTAGCIVGSIGFFYSSSHLDFRAVGLVVFLAVGFMTFISRPHALSAILRFLPSRLKALSFLRPITLKHWLAALCCSGVFGWLTEGLALVALCRIMNPFLEYRELGFLLTCSAFAYLCGVATLIAPAGLGVREGVLVFLLKAKMPLADAIFVTFSIRLCVVSADLIFSVPLGLGVALSKWRDRTSTDLKI